MTDAEKKQYLPQIAATLKYGRYWEEKRKLYIILLAVFTAFMIAFSAIPVYYLGIEQVEPFENPVQPILVITGLCLAFVSPPVIFLVLILRNERARKEILLWLDDAVETDAHSYLYSTTSAGRGLNELYKIKIKFKIDGKHISVLSKDHPTGGGINRGYSLFWRKYIDKGLRILYSPKYEEVMILKDHT